MISVCLFEAEREEKRKEEKEKKKGNKVWVRRGTCVCSFAQVRNDKGN
jgi:hypothetical protein